MHTCEECGINSEDVRSTTIAVPPAGRWRRGLLCIACAQKLLGTMRRDDLSSIVPQKA